ncbi:TRAP transporter large permease [Desulfoferula mesophila]|uniref:C4-dicarboxylate ABC transporter permease n=1 Tax=Desulfoferula mesophila TaxID=3058419 RepID=A0AAU9EKT6_9BACT|nr:C4-dicarboxylate ABC transporter permease [Desulfoferula mesophilus]
MGNEFLGLISVFVLMACVALGIPIAFSMLLTGFLGYAYFAGFDTAISQLLLVGWHESAENFVMVCIPLYILMGFIVSNSGIAKDLYAAAYKWFGHWKGGLAIATVFACAGFGAITGSSAATASTIGSLAKPQMDRYGYDSKLSTGCLAASGTLGVLIPPSLVFVFYGAMTEESVGQLFMAGVIPGIVTVLVFAGVIYFWCLWNKKLSPTGPTFSWVERWKSVKAVWPILLLFLSVIGGIYAGVFTPTEGAGIGSSMALLLTVLMKRMTKGLFLKALRETVRLTAMILAIVYGGILYSRFLALTGATEYLVNLLLGMEVNKYLLVIALLAIYLILGMILDVYGMLVLTLPIVFPVIIGLGFSGIWFGVICVVMAEVALITPPVGVNVFVISGVAPDVPLEKIFKGISPFFLGELIVIAFCIAFPWMATWLPETMLGR